MKIKKIQEERARKAAQEQASTVDGGDKSIEDADMNRTGEMSKMSQQETGRKSKEANKHDESIEVAKSGLSNVLSAQSLV